MNNSNYDNQFGGDDFLCMHKLLCINILVKKIIMKNNNLIKLLWTT
jgi:hypothetical protein